jgi:hypothetical protein
MKTSFNQKSIEHAATAPVERKNAPARPGTKTFSHRYERRKVRQQLRHADWALNAED